MLVLHCNQRLGRGEGSKDRVCGWGRCDGVMAPMQERVPEDTLLVFHTLHEPRRTSDPGMWESDAYLAQHVAQLNAAGRHVAQSLLYHVVDVEAMAAQMSQESVLIDNTHPGPDFMMQVSSRAPPQPADTGRRAVRRLILQHLSGYVRLHLHRHMWGVGHPAIWLLVSYAPKRGLCSPQTLPCAM